MDELGPGDTPYRHVRNRARDPPTSFWGLTVVVDGARMAVLSSPGARTHSGFIVAASQDSVPLPQTPLGVTHFRVTFTSPGTYTYICALHDELGMTGQVTVIP